MKYVVTVERVLVYELAVSAKTEEDAAEKVIAQVSGGTINLDSYDDEDWDIREIKAV